ncbi:hypothetical protein [Halioxenophilus aromaticivorans]|uniref:YiaAB two helix domain-containing protein n=1 Tax=Halioxenophilus aromaticivorans TaxID=1306992 RepID=A0AAV3U567_9ALTE
MTSWLRFIRSTYPVLIGFLICLIALAYFSAQLSHPEIFYVFGSYVILILGFKSQHDSVKENETLKRLLDDNDIDY